MRNLPRVGLVVALMVAPLSTAFAQDEVPFITTAELKQQMAGPASTWKLLLIDARARIEFSEGRIQGAINLPAVETEKKLPELVKDKSRLLVFYCNGPRCTKSIKGAKAALALGYPNVKIYNDGLPAWAKTRLPIEGKPFPAFEAETISPPVLQAALKESPAPLVVDIRDPVEFNDFHLAGSRNIPVDELPDRLSEFPSDRTVYLVDHIGHQTPLASRFLNGQGRSKLKRLDGGLMAWRSQGLPVTGAK